jgi:hypothetical protein
MRKTFIFLNFIGLLLSVTQISAVAKTDFEVPVEVVEVKDLGLSDRDESKSLIEVSWCVSEDKKEKITAFNLILSVTYADGTTVTEKRKFEKSVFSARVEIPSVKPFGGRSSAFIKKMEARVSAKISKK